MDIKKIIGAIIGIMLFSLSIVGLTYAFYSWRSPSVEESNVGFTVSDCLQIEYESGEDTLAGTFNKDNDYKIKSVVTISKKKSCSNDNLYSHFYLNINDISNNLVKNSNFKWSIYEEDNIINTGNFNGEKKDNDIPLYINNKVKEDAIKYTILLYLDKDKVETEEKEEISTTIKVKSSTLKGEKNTGLYDSLYIQSLSNDKLEIKATAKDFGFSKDGKNPSKIVSYSISTPTSTLTNWQNLSGNNIEETITYTLPSYGTYYVWFKNDKNIVTSKEIVVEEAEEKDELEETTSNEDDNE